jgi:glycosyltransferase 2 family protein
MVFKKNVKKFFQILGPIIFIYILFQIDYRFLFEEIKLLKWHFLILAVFFMLFEVAVKSFRWQCILSSLRIIISTGECLSLFWLGLFVGVITPGRFGELIKVYFLKNKGYSAFRSFFSVILDRIIDIFVLLFFGFLIFIFFLRDIGAYMIIFGAVLLLIIILIFLLFDQRSWLNRFFGKIIQKVFPVDFKKYSRFSFKKLWQGVKNLEKKRIAYFAIYLFIGWLLYFLSRYFIVLSLGVELSFFDVSIISILVAIVTMLPISVAGLGTREAAVIYLFSLFSLNKEIALLFSLLIFTVDLLAVSFGLIPYIKESSLINKIRKA